MQCGIHFAQQEICLLIRAERQMTGPCLLSFCRADTDTASTALQVVGCKRTACLFTPVCPPIHLDEGNRSLTFFLAYRIGDRRVQKGNKSVYTHWSIGLHGPSNQVRLSVFQMNLIGLVQSVVWMVACVKGALTGLCSFQRVEEILVGGADLLTLV